MAELKGYGYSEISLKKVEKDTFVLAPEIEAQIGREELKAQMTEALKNNGKVYFIFRKKETCGVVILKYEKHLALEFDLSDKEKTEENLDGKETKKPFGVKMEHESEKFMDGLVELETKGRSESDKDTAEEANAYKLAAFYVIDELQSKEAIIRKNILKWLKEAAAFNDLGIKVIIWKDTIVADKTIGKTRKSSIEIGMCFGMCFGIVFGLLFDNIAIGMLLGMAMGTGLGTAYFSSAKKVK